MRAFAGFCALVLTGCGAQGPVADRPNPAIGDRIAGDVQIVAILQPGLDPVGQARLQRQVNLAAAATGRPYRIGTDFPPTLILFVESDASGPIGLRDLNDAAIVAARADLSRAGRCDSRAVAGRVVGHVPADLSEPARGNCIRTLVTAAMAGPPV